MKIIFKVFLPRGCRLSKHPYVCLFGMREQFTADFSQASLGYIPCDGLLQRDNFLPKELYKQLIK